MNAAQLGDKDFGIEVKLFFRIWSGTKAIDRGIVTEEQVDAGSDTSAHDIKVIPSFLHHYQATIAEHLSQVDNHFRELRKACCRKIHLPERVIPCLLYTSPSPRD